MHGGGFVLGSFISHGRLARELALQADAVVAFIGASLAPEARYPVQIKQCYAAAKWLIAQASEHGIDSSRLGGRGQLSRREHGDGACDPGQAAGGDLHIVHQSLYYPITDAGEDTDSYRQFHNGRMERRR